MMVIFYGVISVGGFRLIRLTSLVVRCKAGFDAVKFRFVDCFVKHRLLWCGTLCWWRKVSLGEVEQFASLGLVLWFNALFSEV